jgi:hypothetical protein
MNSNQFRNELKKEPFEPFSIKVTSGDVLDVIHPDFAMISPEGDVVIVFDRNNNYKVVDMEHVVTLTPKRERKRSKSPKK